MQEYVDKLGLNVLFVLNPLTNWDPGDAPVLKAGERFLPNGDKGFQAWKKYVKAVVERYKDKVHNWMIFNEPADDYKHANQKSYARLVKIGYKAIKALDPDALVSLGGSTSSLKSVEWLDKVLGILKTDWECTDGCFDIFDYHPYGFMTEYSATTPKNQDIPTMLIFTG